MSRGLAGVAAGGQRRRGQVRATPRPISTQMLQAGERRCSTTLERVADNAAAAVESSPTRRRSRTIREIARGTCTRSCTRPTRAKGWRTRSSTIGAPPTELTRLETNLAQLTRARRSRRAAPRRGLAATDERRQAAPQQRLARGQERRARPPRSSSARSWWPTSSAASGDLAQMTELHEGGAGHAGRAGDGPDGVRAAGAGAGRRGALAGAARAGALRDLARRRQEHGQRVVDEKNVPELKAPRGRQADARGKRAHDAAKR